MPEIRLLAVLLASALGVSPVHAHHTTDHTMQQLEYERQQREYWRQQEQKREEERRQQQIYQDNARRQQEEANRARSASTPKSSVDDPTPPAGNVAPRPPTSGDASAICKAHPVRGGERNPLIGGRWRPASAPAGDAFTQLFQMMASPMCATFQAGIEFRERTHVSIIGEFPVRYGHKGDVWFACFPETTYGFRVEEANQVAVLGAEPACRLRREGAQLAQATSASTGATVAGTATSSAAAGGGAAVLALSAAIAPNGAPVPVNGGSFFVLKSSVESVMEQAGIRRAPSGSHVKGWQIACDSGAPACRQGVNALIGASVAVAKTDASGRTRTTPVAPGRYYVFGAAPTASPLFWNVQVDLKPGSNTIALDQSNATPLN